MPAIRVLKKFRMILSSHQKFRIIQLIILMVLGGILETCSVSLIIPFMNVVMNPEETMEKWYAKEICEIWGLESSRSFLVFLAVTLSLIYLLKNVYLLFEYNIQYRFVYGNMFAMQERLLNNFFHRPYEYYLEVKSSEIIRIVNSDTPNTFILLSVLLTLFTELIVSGMLIATVFFITPIVTIIIASVLILMLLAVYAFIKPKLRNAGISNQKANAGMNKWLLQSIQGIKEIKVMGKEEFFKSNFNLYGRDYVSSIRKYAVLGIVPRFFIEAVGLGTLFMAIAIMIYVGTELEKIVPMISAIAMAALRLLPSVNRVSNSLASISYNEPMLDKLIENLDDLHEDNLHRINNKIEESGIENKNIKYNHEIFFKNITYSYPKTDIKVIQKASMNIKKGEAIGIIGSSGSGKTTSVDIILGLLKPQEGAVLVDGIDINENINSWVSQVGYIPQSIFLLDDTIKANIAFGINKELISEEKVWESLKEASLGEFISSLPEGIDTEIGERGIRLSGGQRQRIGIARALYNNPEVLIFDEATSALDNETEASIMESINALYGKKTMIIIAHRLTTISNCDRIYKVVQGRIIEEKESNE